MRVFRGISGFGVLDPCSWPDKNHHWQRREFIQCDGLYRRHNHAIDCFFVVCVYPYVGPLPIFRTPKHCDRDVFSPGSELFWRPVAVILLILYRWKSQLEVLALLCQDRCLRELCNAHVFFHAVFAVCLPLSKSA